MSTLEELLESNRAFDVEYRKGLSNHLSMALVALHRLGASDQRLQAYFEVYRRRLEPRRTAATTITSGTWRDHLGTSQHQAGYIHFFDAELDRLGLAGLLSTYLPTLVPGVATAAFHAVIRLAYALEAPDPRDVPVALAYLADAYLPLGDGTGAAAIAEPPVELLRRLGRTPGLSGRSWPDGLITDQLRAIAAEPAFASVIDWLPAAETTLEALAEAALLMYASSGDFTALHALTGTHALRVVLPHLSDPTTAMRYHFQALAAAYISTGTPPFLGDAEVTRLIHQETPPWNDICAAANRSSDEHVIKLVYSAREEEAVYRHPLYRYVAARKAGFSVSTSRPNR